MYAIERYTDEHREKIPCKTASDDVYMRYELTAVYEQDVEWTIASCPEVPGADGQERTKLDESSERRS